MSTSGTELREALAHSVGVSDDALVVDLADGRTITVPLAWFPRLRRTWFPPARWLRRRWAALSRPSRRASGWTRAIRTCCRISPRRWCWMSELRSLGAGPGDPRRPGVCPTDMAKIQTRRIGLGVALVALAGAAAGVYRLRQV